MFTPEDVIEEAHKKYGRAICVDKLRDAMEMETLEEAAKVLIEDSEFWDQYLDMKVIGLDDDRY